MLVHAAGKAEQLPLWPSIVCAAEQWRIDTRLDPNLSVVTFNNGGSLNQPYKRLGLFEASLRRNGIDDVAVLGQSVTEWRHNLKVNLLLEYLNTAAVKISSRWSNGSGRSAVARCSMPSGGTTRGTCHPSRKRWRPASSFPS